MNSGSASSTVGNERMFRRLSYLLVFLMMTSGALTMASLIQNVAPSWHAGIIAAVLLFIVLDRFYTYQGLKSVTPLSTEWVIALGAQWIVIIGVIRLLLSYANGLDSFRTDMSRLARGYLIDVFTVEFVFSVLLALLVWYLSGRFLSLLDEIGLDQAVALQDDPPIQNDAVPARQRLLNMVLSIGIVLVILTAVARLNLRNIVSDLQGIPHVELNRLSGGEAGALLYFVFGLALLSLSRLMSLQTHWNRQRIPVVSGDLMRQWGIYSLFFLLILGMTISLLPAGDSIGLFSLLATLFGFLAGILLFIGQLIFFLIAVLLSLFLSLLLRGDSSPAAPGPPPLPVLPPAELAAPTSSSEVLLLIRSILLWASLAVIIVFALIHFVRQHGGIRAALRKSRVVDWLILAWQWLYRRADKTRGSLSRAITEGWQSIVARLEGKRILPRPGFISLRLLDPRRRVFFFYLAMVHRSAEQGLGRRQSHTPSEYAVQLEKALPSASEDIDWITEAFIEARYSRQAVDARKAEAVKTTWGRIRRALRDKFKEKQTANKS